MNYKNVNKIILKINPYEILQLILLKNDKRPEIKQFTNFNECIKLILDIFKEVGFNFEQYSDNLDSLLNRAILLRIYDFYYSWETEKSDYYNHILNYENNYFNKKEQENKCDCKIKVINTSDGSLKKYKSKVGQIGKIMCASMPLLSSIVLPQINNCISIESASTLSEFEQITSDLDSDSIAIKEHHKVFDFLNVFNHTLKDKAMCFELYTEQNYEQIIHTSIVFNEYNGEELLDIFGSKGLTVEMVFNDFLEVCKKADNIYKLTKTTAYLERIINNFSNKHKYYDLISDLSFLLNNQEYLDDIKKQLKQNINEYELKLSTIIASKIDFITEELYDANEPELAELAKNRAKLPEYLLDDMVSNLCKDGIILKNEYLETLEQLDSKANVFYSIKHNTACGYTYETINLL